MRRWPAIVFLVGVGVALAACSKSTSEPKPAPVAAEGSGTHEDRHDPATAPAKLTLEVATGATTATWADAEFAKVPKMVGKATDGEARDTWSLRELAHTLVGPGARVATVVGKDGQIAITPEAWNDPARTPILHTTRRGTLKFRWADPTGAWGETAVRDVTRIEIAN